MTAEFDALASGYIDSLDARVFPAGVVPPALANGQTPADRITSGGGRVIHLGDPLAPPTELVDSGRLLAPVQAALAPFEAARAALTAGDPPPQPSTARLTVTWPHDPGSGLPESVDVVWEGGWPPLAELRTLLADCVRGGAQITLDPGPAPT